MSQPPNGISIGSAVFARLTNVTNRPTDHADGEKDDDTKATRKQPSPRRCVCQANYCTRHHTLLYAQRTISRHVRRIALRWRCWRWRVVGCTALRTMLCVRCAVEAIYEQHPNILDDHNALLRRRFADRPWERRSKSSSQCRLCRMKKKKFGEMFHPAIRYGTVDQRALKSWRDGQPNLTHGTETKKRKN